MVVLQLVKSMEFFAMVAQAKHTRSDRTIRDCDKPADERNAPNLQASEPPLP